MSWFMNESPLSLCYRKGTESINLPFLLALGLDGGFTFFFRMPAPTADETKPHLLLPLWPKYKIDPDPMTRLYYIILCGCSVCICHYVILNSVILSNWNHKVTCTEICLSISLCIISLSAVSNTLRWRLNSQKYFWSVNIIICVDIPRKHLNHEEVARVLLK